MSDNTPVRPAPSSPALQSHVVWDADVRWFHWINVLCVLGLIGVGIVILNGSACRPCCSSCSAPR
jgi:Ni,Fe-hydrogenase I cytochrome b subunit